MWASYWRHTLFICQNWDLSPFCSTNFLETKSIHLSVSARKTTRRQLNFSRTLITSVSTNESVFSPCPFQKQLANQNVQTPSIPRPSDNHVNCFTRSSLPHPVELRCRCETGKSSSQERISRNNKSMLWPRTWEVPSELVLTWFARCCVHSFSVDSSTFCFLCVRRAQTAVWRHRH